MSSVLSFGNLQEETGEKAIRVKADSAIAVIDQLLPYTDYSVRMTASNEIGEGPTSQSITVITAESSMHSFYVVFHLFCTLLLYVGACSMLRMCIKCTDSCKLGDYASS